MADWQATASKETLIQRAQLLAALREFFAQRDVLEVETPQLSKRTVTDLHLQSFPVPGERDHYFLQTSPEYAMKRLLACGSGSIYQICKAWRDEAPGRQHNPEFTMLEWYRTGFSLEQLMDEVEDLTRQILNCASIPRFSYKALFLEHLDINPHTAEKETLAQLAARHIELSTQNLSTTDYLQLLMHHIIEPRLPEQCLVFDYPQDQAALACISSNQDGEMVAQRFELYCNGMEIANGYQELIDADEQLRRFQQDQAKREQAGLPAIAEDERLLDALRSGMPECSGVALGVDRLLMVLLGADSIEQVLSFPVSRA